MRIVLAFLCVALAPSSAWAVLAVHVESRTRAPSSQDEIVLLDIFARDLDGSDEQLNAFTFGLNLLSPRQPGVRFLPGVFLPGSNPHVFRDFTAGEPELLAASDSRLVIGARIPAGRGVNVTNDAGGLARVQLFVPAGFSDYATVTFDPFSANFTGTRGTVIAVPGDAGGVGVLPEPSAALTAIVAAATLLRRRPARRSPPAR